MKRILVVDDLAVFREPIAASLRLAGYETFTAPDGEEALQVTRANHPDVILLDASMPKMDGITFLKHLRADSTIAGTHIIMLTARSEKQYILAAGSLGVRDYLLKSRFRLTELLERIKKLEGAAAPEISPTEEANSPSAAPKPASTPTAPASSAAATAPAVSMVMTPKQFLDRVTEILRAQKVSKVVADIISLATSPRSDKTRIAGIVARDPVLTERILQVANHGPSALRNGPVADIAKLVHKVGCSKVLNIAASLGIFECVPTVAVDNFYPIRCLQHSFAVAHLSQRLVTGTKMADQAELAYLIGLCHDLGAIFIRAHFAGEYQQFRTAMAATGKPAEELQNQMFGMTLRQMMTAVLKNMGLPKNLQETIDLFHSPGRLRANDPLVNVLWMAENQANAMMLASNASSEVAAFTESFCRTAIGNPNPPRPDYKTISSEVVPLTAALARLPQAQEGQLTTPMFAPRAAKVWISCAAGVSKFNPVAAALGALCNVQIENRLPTAPEAGDVSGILIVVPSVTPDGYTQSDIDRASSGHPDQPLPFLAISCEAPGHNEGSVGIPWRASISLAELAGFVEKLSEKKPLKEAA